MAIMSSTSLATALPPTCNVLDAEQRSRLIKTTRKLGKVLGATPVVVADAESSSSNFNAFDHARMPERVARSAASSSLDLSYPGVSNRKGAALTRSRSLSQASQLSGTTTESATSSTYPFLGGRDVQSHHGHGCGMYTASSSSNALLAHHHLKQQQAAFAASRPSLNLTDRIVSGGSGSSGASPQQPVLRLPPVYGHAHSLSLAIPIHSSSSRSSTAPPSPTSLTFEPSSSASSSSSDSSAQPQSPAENEPCSPLFDEPFDIDEARMRKRRMDKLMRHLGERIPSELVFGSSSSSSTGVSRPSSPALTFAKVPMMTQVTHTTVSPSSTVSIPSLNKKRSLHSSGTQESSQQQQPTTRTERRTSVSIVSSSALSLGRVSGMGPFTYRKQFELPAPDVPPLPSKHAAGAGTPATAASMPNSLRVRSGANMDRVAEEGIDAAGRQGGEDENDWNAEAYQDVVKRLRALKR